MYALFNDRVALFEPIFGTLKEHSGSNVIWDWIVCDPI